MRSASFHLAGFDSDTQKGSPQCSPSFFDPPTIPISAWYSSLVFGTCFATIELSRRSGLARLSSLQPQFEI